jgi:hypothetical protein
MEKFVVEDASISLAPDMSCVHQEWPGASALLPVHARGGRVVPRNGDDGIPLQI